MCRVVMDLNGKARQKMTLILIIDHHDEFRRTTGRFLEIQNNGVQVIEAADAASGIRLALEKKPEIILLDVELPDMNGIEAARQIKAGLAETRIIVLTVFEVGRFKRLYDNKDIADFISKDEIYERLLPSIRKVISESNPLGA